MNTKTTNGETTGRRIGVVLSHRDYKRLRAAAEERRLSTSSYVRELIGSHLDALDYGGDGR